MPSSKPMTFPVSSHGKVSGLLLKPRAASACYVLAHGAGAGMTHPFMEAIALSLAAMVVLAIVDLIDAAF